MATHDSTSLFSVDQAADLVRKALRIEVISVLRQTLTESGNSVFQAILADGQSVAVRVSPKANAYKYTQQNLKALRDLGLPVQRVLAVGVTAKSGSFVILNWMRGRDLMYELPAMRPEQMTRVAEAVVDVQKRVGTLPMSQGFGWAPIGKHPPEQRWTDIFGPAETEPAAAGAGVVDDLKTRLRQLRLLIEPHFITVKPVCFLDDLTIKNVLVERGELTGILDVDFVCYGDPLMSVGTTLALLDSEVGLPGAFYGQELVRCSNISLEQRRAIHFYQALWTIGMLSAAEQAGNAERADRLARTADALLGIHESEATVQSVEQVLASATHAHRAGNLARARQLYQRALAREPDHAVGQFRLGLLEMQWADLPAALGLIQRAVNISPENSRYRFGLGEVFTAMRRWDDAAAAYRHAIEIDPAFADAFLALGSALQRKGDVGAAEGAYRRALVLDPNCASAMSNLATILQSQGQADQAIELLRSACRLEPDAEHHAVNLGAAFCQKRQFADAAGWLSDVVDRYPQSVDARFNLGNALAGLGRSLEAVSQFEQVLAFRPDHAEALNNLGNVYKQLGEYPLATAAYEAAVRSDERSVAAMNNLGCLHRTLGRLDEAEAILRQGLLRDAMHPALHDNLGNVLKDSGRLEEAIACFTESLRLDPSSTATHSNLAYSLSFSATRSQPILTECRRWNARHVAPLQMPASVFANELSPDRRLRIGYVSPDFRDHCQSLFTAPLLSHHDHERFEIHCYSSVERPDGLTQRIAGYADIWRDVRPLDDAALCDLIRADRIDILVDLTMHMADGRPMVFARRPAPVQVVWLAYPGTTGIAGVDYRLSDWRLDPAGSDDAYSEKTIRLPDAFWCYDPLTEEPEVNESPVLSRGYVTLGCLNNPCKLSDRTLAMWSEVLRGLPGSRLLLMAAAGSGRRQLVDRATAQRIDPHQIDFVSYRPRSEYLRTYHSIDLGLDTFPYNGHTTSLDSFWMGVPVVTRVGDTCVGRGGLSQLYQLGLPGLAAESDEEYVEIAMSLGRDLPKLIELRRGLRGRLADSPLTDGKRFARNIEAAYRDMWRNYCGVAGR